MILFVVFFLSCKETGNQLTKPDFTYRITKFANKENIQENFVECKYYDTFNRVVEEIGFEYRTLYKYDNSGKLIGKFHCRIYDCDIGIWELVKYDDNGNVLGTFNTPQSFVNWDTVNFEQVHFYDEQNRLIREQTMKSDSYVAWKEYRYRFDKVLEEIEIGNGDTVWVGGYRYDDSGRILSIQRARGHLYENEFFKYDSVGNLAERKIDSNKYPLNEKTIFSVENNRTVYKYSSSGRLEKEIIYDHNDREYQRFIYVYETMQ